MQQLLGQTIHNRYRIQSLLGRQTGRRTFLATDLATQSPVVVKLLLFNPDFTWEDFKLFEREANTLKALDHAAIPQYLDSFELDTQLGKGFALVQSYIDASSLETAIQAGRLFTEADLIEIAGQILEILIYLHGQNPPVIHRDIKPSNILLANRSGHSVGTLYLVDFGSVQTAINQNSGTITIVGSYGYIPLEQFAGKTTTASDLYGLGMTLIYLITGVHPADLPQINGQVDFSGDRISYRFSRWLKQMTNPHLDRRFDSTTAALKALHVDAESDGCNSHLKPASSQVELYRDCDRIEIITQKTPVADSCAGCIVLAFFSIILSLSTGSLVIGTSLFLSIILISGIYARNLVTTKEVLCIERNTKISIFYRRGSTQREHHSSPFQAINLLAYNPGYTFDRYINEQGRTITGGTVTISPNLSVYAGSLEYQVGGGHLSQAELWWLGQELSDFLNLEMKIIYPTPKVPAEQTCGCGC
ncbi:Serine/threonine-protein kinase [Halomicronema hongdechloris C2206]|uniref:Serine/threonine-protein kinase n=1 Tax=Halomicronema hongdechloris C2206 TaxID=1641165 RepID=A0A1Z3HJT7_9CYAN|nr:serine/threonine-protein kinase [Halomicronema hongdechloris]ASC70582.1 Serine/threonine-protein kinase [Halomicronema hongdechloris C2206]